MYNNHIMILVNNLFFVIIRIFIIIYMMPVLGDTIISNKVKFFLSFLIGILVVPTIPFTGIVLFSYHGLIFLIEQVVIGIAIGFFIKMILLFIIVAGEVITSQIGLYNVTYFDYDLSCNISILTKILNVFLLLLFLFYDGHLFIISLIVKSFYLFPLYKNKFDINIILKFIIILHESFFNGIILIFPIMIILLSLNILIGLIFRLSTQISTFFTGFSLFYFIVLFFLLYSNNIFFSFLQHILKKIIILLFKTFSL